MAAAFVQQIATSNASASSLATGNFGSSNTAGNLIYAVCTVASGNLVPDPPTDTLGNTYYLLGSTGHAGVANTYHFYAKNIAAGTNSVTFVGSATAQMDVYASEWSGLDTSTPLVVTACQWINPGSGTADSAVSPTVILQYVTQNMLMIGFDHDINGRTHTNPGDEGTGFTALANVFTTGTGGYGMPEYKAITTAGSYKATFDDPAFDQHNVLMVIFTEPRVAVVTRPTDTDALRRFHLEGQDSGLESGLVNTLEWW